MERTLAIIKPEVVERGEVGKIIMRIEEEKLRIAAMKMLRLTKAQAEGFYHVHRDKFFFDELTTYMSSGPVVVMVLEGENAIRRWRKLMGATDPAKAEEGTIRREFGTDIQQNAVHGSDSEESAAFEIGYFFAGMEFHA